MTHNRGSASLLFILAAGTSMAIVFVAVSQSTKAKAKRMVGLTESHRSFYGSEIAGLYGRYSNATSPTPVPISDTKVTSGIQNYVPGELNITVSADQICGETKRTANSPAYKTCVARTGASLPSPTPSASPTDTIVFVTSTWYNGNLGGLAGADAKCKAVAVGAGLRPDSDWKAIISDSTVNAASRITQVGQIKNTANQKVFNAGALFSGSNLSAMVNYNENGVALNESDTTNVWTGTSNTGIGTTRYCSNWTSSSTSVVGNAGTSGTLTDWLNWTGDPNYSCNKNFHLFCISQVPTPSPTVTPTPTPTATSTPISGVSIDFSSGNTTGHPASSSIDGNLTTYWNSGTGFSSGSQFLKFNLGGQYNLGKIRIKSGAASSLKLNLYLSATCGGTETNPPPYSFTSILDGDWIELPVNVNNIGCVSIDHLSGDPGPSSITFYEVEFYISQTPISGVSIFGSSGITTGHPASSSIDGNVTTYWNSSATSSGGSKWLALNLGTQYNLSKIRIKSGATSSLRLTVYVYPTCGGAQTTLPPFNFTSVLDGDWIELPLSSNGVGCVSIEKLDGDPGPSSLTYYEVEFYKQ